MNNPSEIRHQQRIITSPSTLLVLSILTCFLAFQPIHAEGGQDGDPKNPQTVELKFSELSIDGDFEPVEWSEAVVPWRRPRHHGDDAFRVATNLEMHLDVDGEPRPFHHTRGDVAVLDDGDRRLRFYLLAGTWSVWDRRAEEALEKAALTAEEAIVVARQALSEVTDLTDRDHAVAFANTLTEIREDGELGDSRVLSYNVFFQSRLDSVQVVGGGGVSSATITGSLDEPGILHLAHAAGDFELDGGKVLWQEKEELIIEAEARQRLLEGMVLLADTPPDTVVAGTITRVARAYFADGRYLHREAIPVYVYQVVFEPLVGEPFSRDYFVSALSEAGWQALGYSEVELASDSRVHPGIAGFDLTPDESVWQDDETFVFPSPSARAAVLEFARDHCVPQWLSSPGTSPSGTWDVAPWCVTPCVDREDFCAGLGADPERTYAISVRWGGLTASHIPDVAGGGALPADYRQAWIDRLREGFEAACYDDLPGYGTDGVVSDAPDRPDRSDVVDSADAGFYFHMSHGWGDETIECPGVKRRFDNIAPMGFSIEPFTLFPIPLASHVTSCGIGSDWSGKQLRYFFTMSSYGNAGRRQWTRVVGGGPDNPKVVIGHLGHGNRFYFSPYAPDPSASPPAETSQSYPSMLSNFFRNLTLLDTSDWLECRPGGMSFRAAMRDAVTGTATSQTDYGWGSDAHQNHPKAMRLVFSTEIQSLDEHLPGWGDQYPNDGNYTGWEYLAWGSEWSP